ncbi:alpha-tubulin suppressor protein [Toxoplasma gondii GAB2-2007-GAL-DOM2]|uniref:Alpha-tubulin suppressor protein n=5 Tax=Toxoplasma gondii TaxID=5811 RepID=S7UHP4_TOXGG|nr:alpha-tubulin suppressor protein [Toxoplasma gondii GT1]KAF4644069.1 alpha-tubulin suppressor protein [Toxoplasma gondii]KFG38875.1 alpha-tubulin suppressor protein [Toxoplasma gondii GAB2-2007-GAL-DOM2]KFG42923.1 alpha-tubulin suppressor protein [Toxoplasma gondii FOU]RQX74175.1 alpha-tubulin suppressor protein [Toxoplasma gondii CAST]
MVCSAVAAAQQLQGRRRLEDCSLRPHDCLSCCGFLPSGGPRVPTAAQPCFQAAVDLHTHNDFQFSHPSFEEKIRASPKQLSCAANAFLRLPVDSMQLYSAHHPSSSVFYCRRPPEPRMRCAVNSVRRHRNQSQVCTRAAAHRSERYGVATNQWGHFGKRLPLATKFRRPLLLFVLFTMVAMEAAVAVLPRRTAKHSQAGQLELVMDVSASLHSRGSQRRRFTFSDNELMHLHDSPSSLQVAESKSFEGFEGTAVALTCGSLFISIKSATWKSSTGACPAVRDCHEQMRRLCDGFFSCRVVPVASDPASAEASGLSAAKCGDVCSMSADPRRILTGEYECVVKGGTDASTFLDEHSAGASTTTGLVTWDAIQAGEAAPTASEIGGAGGISSFVATQASQGLNMISYTDTDSSDKRAAIDRLASQNPASAGLLQLSADRSVNKVWFTQGAFAAQYVPDGTQPATIVTVGMTAYGGPPANSAVASWEHADFACGAADTFAISQGLTPRHTTASTPQIICSNASSEACTELQAVNEAIKNSRPKTVMLEGIACHREGKAFGLLFADGTVLAFGAADRGGTMSAEAKGDLSTFDATRSQRVKKIVATQGAMAVLLLRGSVYAWGLDQFGGTLPSPEPTGVVDLVANDVGFAALTGGGSVYTWGKGMVVPSRLAGVEIKKIVGEKTCFAAFDAKGGVYIWGLGSNEGAFCNEEFVGERPTISQNFSDVKTKLSEGITDVRFNEHAAMAVKKPAVADGSWEIITWGTSAKGGEVPSYVLSGGRKGVKAVGASKSAFAIVSHSGDVYGWGDKESGGDGWNQPFLAGRAYGLVSLTRSFVALLVTGEAFAWGGNGQTLISSARRQELGTVVESRLVRGLYVVSGVGEGEIFVGTIGIPCVPGEWGAWGSCRSVCEGIRQRERTIELEPWGGTCESPLTEAGSCKGPKYGTDECPSTETDNSSIEAGLSLGVIVGCATASVAVLGVVGFMGHMWCSGFR